MHTKFQIKTTVDITNHNKVTKEDKVKYGQKQNFLTLLNTIGLRVNPTVEDDPYKTNTKEFGSNDVWQFDFSVEYEKSLTIDMLVNDFMFVPFVAGLEETEVFEQPVFITKGKNLNILFEEINNITE